MNVGTESPWGTIDYCKEINGVFIVGTPSHGGIFVPDELLSQIPAKERRFAAYWSHGWGENWFEEDCAAISPAYHFKLDPEVFDKCYPKQTWEIR